VVAHVVLRVAPVLLAAMAGAVVASAVAVPVVQNLPQVAPAHSALYVLFGPVVLVHFHQLVQVCHEVIY
jgi:hypothetical protein